MSWVITGSQKVNWDPSRITTALWLDAADSSTVQLDSGAVSQWNDKSGNGRHASQGTAGNRPVYQASAKNGLSAIRFTAASAHFLTSGTTSTWNFLHNGTASSVFIAAKVGNVGDNPNAQLTYLSTGGAGSNNIGYWIAYDDVSSVSRNNGLGVRVAKAQDGVYASNDNTNDKISPGTYHLISSYIDADNATAASRAVQRVDGSASFGSNVSTSPPLSSNSTYALTIGRDSISATLDFTGDICEILIFNTQPGTTDRQKIEGYLAHKWGLTANLPSDHPFKTAVPVP
jgi:hypothetical protein